MPDDHVGGFQARRDDGMLNVSHPDIEAFIDAKRDPAKFRMFNLSVLVTDAFMKAVEDDADWFFQFEGKLTGGKVRARALWEKIVRSTYDYAEPGILFIDRMNERNNLAYCETLIGTNPCGEIPLSAYGACLLGSINLAALVEDPFTDHAEISFAKLAALVKTAVRMLDNVVDISNYPLPQQKAEAKAKRRIGLGVTGLADALAMCGLHYGTGDARGRAASWMRWIAETAYDASQDLADEKGHFPAYDADGYEIKNRDLHVYLDDGIGIRNSHLTSIAPTGTISLLAGNVSSGIEPIFDLEYTRKVLNADGTKREELVQDYAFRKWLETGNQFEVPEALVTAHELTPEQHLLMQAALQPYINSAISKTINCPADVAFEDFRDIYTQAYKFGLKGCTAYRPNDITGSVLEAAVKDAKAGETVVLDLDPEAVEAAIKLHDERDETIRELTQLNAKLIEEIVKPSRPNILAPRDAVLSGKTYKLKWAGSEHATYVTINDVDDWVNTGHAGEHGTLFEKKRRPYEIFINTKNPENYAWTVAMTRMISAIFRRGGDIDFVSKELREVFDPTGGAWTNGKYVPSLPAAIGDIIDQHRAGDVPDTAIADAGQPDTAPDTTETAPEPDSRPLPQTFCPRCSSANVVREEGCLKCRSCGWSKCA